MKVYRLKRRSCILCKPHKMGAQPMWKPKVFAKLKAMEKELRHDAY